jgi:hypothetical protein
MQKLVPQVPKMQNPLTAPRKVGQKRKDEENGDDGIIGCPDHSHFRKNCNACLRVLKFKEDLTKDLISYGFSVNDIQAFVRLDRNKINKIKQEE